MPSRIALVVLTALLAGCGSNGFQNTLIRQPTDPIQAPVELEVEVPDRYDVLDSDYATAYVNTVSGDMAPAIQGRSTLTLRVRDRTTGELALLVYEDLRARATPTTILRIRAAPSR